MNKQNYLLAKVISAAWVILPSIYIHVVISKGSLAILLLSLAIMFLVASYVEESSCLRFIDGKMRAKLIAICLILSMSAIFVNSLPDLSGLYLTLYRIGLVLIFLISCVTEYIWSGIRFRDGKAFIFVQFMTWDLNLKNIATWLIVFGGIAGLGFVSTSLGAIFFENEIVAEHLYKTGLNMFLFGFVGAILYGLEALYWLGKNRRRVIVQIRELKENSIFGKKFKERIR